MSAEACPLVVTCDHNAGRLVRVAEQHPTTLQLHAWIDGEIDDVTSIEAHVAACNGCQLEVRRVRSLGDAIRAWAAAVVRPDSDEAS